MLGNLNGPTLLVILFVIVLLFGAPKLPALARSLGQSMRILKKEVRPEDADADNADKGGNANKRESAPDQGVATEQKVADTEATGSSSAENAQSRNSDSGTSGGRPKEAPGA